jgi:hypothetical protein
LQRYRKDYRELQETAQSGGGLRQRGARAANATTGADGAAATTEDDSTGKGGTEDGGFALWQLLLLAFIAFLLGRLTSEVF